jgi:PAS domain S-box-containing protein
VASTSEIVEVQSGDREAALAPAPGGPVQRLRPLGRLALAVLQVCAGYYGAGIVALALRLEPGGISTIWLPHGVLLAALILSPVRLWWLYFAALLPAHLHLVRQFQGPVPLEVMFVQFGGNLLQAILGAIAVRRFIGTPPRFDALRPMVMFIVLGVVLPAALVSALVAELFLLQGWVGDFGLAWHRRTLTGICAALVLTPLIVAIAAGGEAAIKALTPRRKLEFLVLTIGLLALVLSGAGWERGLASQYALLFLPLPLLLWTAVRFGPGGLAPQLLIVVIAALMATKAGQGPFVTASAAESVLSVQAFLLSVSIPLLLLAALVAERNRSTRALDERLKFERLVSEVSARLINPARDEVDEEIGNALNKVLAGMELDRCSVFEYRPEQRCCRITHSAQSAKCPPVRREIADAELAWLLRQLQAGVTVVLNEVARDLPPEALAERRYAEGYGSRSWLAVPVTVDRDVVHAVSYHSNKQRNWPPDLVSRLQLLAEILISSLTSRQAAEALHLSEQRYREVVESQTELVCRYLPDTTLTFVNEAYCRFFGRPREELIGRKFLDLIPDSAQVATLRHIASLLKEPRVCAYEHEVVAANGTFRWQEWVDYVVVASDGRVVELQGIGRDITDRKQAERASHRLADRLTAIGELTASIAHEINQPLSAILANADAAELLLEAGPERLDEVRQILCDIRKDNLWASEVIRRVRELLHKRPLERQPLELNEVVSEVLQLLGAEATRRTVTVETELAPGLPAVHGDRVQLQQVLQNLLLNGMDAMADVPPFRRRLLVRTARHATCVEVAVTDSGHGFDPAELPRLFESFFTTKKDGLGIGLSIVRSIVEAHGGRIWAENRSEGGATFHFTVPTERAA